MDECGPSLAGDAPPVASDLDVGAELKAGRKKVGLSEIEIAQELRIDLEQVQGLENNQYEGLSSAVFVKGYVRNYARLVGLDPTPLITAIDKGGIQSPALASLSDALHSSDGKHGKRSSIPISGILTGVAVVIGLAILGFVGERMYYLAMESTAGSDINLPTENSSNVLDTSLASVVSGEAEQARVTENGLANTTTKDSVVLLSSVKPIKEEQLAAISAESIRAVAQISKNNESAKAESHKVEKSEEHFISEHTGVMTLHFSSDSWAEVYDAEQARLVSRIGKAGSTATIEGVPPFSLVLGFAPGVSVKYNGENVDVLSRTQGNVARLQIGKANLD
ncbi:MAG: helix-turn-helix domain-containing protein [Gammaproteobacteria bacterium]|nr:helix-turn-helix domain-containing protein [Gammaproteobacteria bacterium]